MSKFRLIAAVCGLISIASVKAQEPTQQQTVEDFRSMSSNQYGQEYPMVNSQRIVRGRILAPKAHEVFLQINGINYPMKMDAEGYWTGDSDPLDEGNHYYGLVIDGANVPDPASLFLYGSGAERTQIEIPAHDEYKYALRDVPHGQVREIWFHSSVTGGMQTRHIALTYPGYFSQIGIFSGGTISVQDLNNSPLFKVQNKLTFISYGSREVENPRGQSPKETVKALKDAGLNAHYYESPETAHEWQTWRRSLYEFA